MAVTNNFYNSFSAEIGKAANLVTDSLKMVLLSSSYTPNLAHSVLSDISAFELSGNGYARQTLGGVSFGQVGGVATFNFSQVTFSASGAGFTARYFAIFDDTVSSPIKPLLCYGLLDDTSGGSDVVVAGGFSVLISPDPVQGLFQSLFV